MSLYNTMFGLDSNADTLLGALGLSRGDVPRFRDCYVDGQHIVIYTRTGGGNRNYYESEKICRENYPDEFESEVPPAGPWNSDLCNHPCFEYDEDDSFDRTYMSFYFRFPEEYRELLEGIAASGAALTPTDKWQTLFSLLEGRAGSGATS